MRNIIILISLIICVSCQNAKAQRTPISNKINLEELRFKGNNSNVFKIDDSPAQMQSALGSPSSEEDYYYEMQQIMAKLYKYDPNKFYFVNQKFEAWEIFNDNVIIGRNGNYFKIGDTVDKVYDAFPEFSNKPVNNGYIDIPLRSVDYDMECTRLIITFENNQIVKIMRHDC
ncbi:hypothetical protein [Marivirga sp.]|uniref:hypothetical protein n=1 Tax=Marivirga sp. TaxID=2018662 RepID=UPI0025F2555E|nr:hypothetical protein [Marivirga sp.]